MREGVAIVDGDDVGDSISRVYYYSGLKT